MAGDWIKMRMELQTHPKIVRIMSATQSDKFRVIGGLHAVWCVFDQHSIDGVLHGYSPDLMDQIIGWIGFSSAMMGVGWLAFNGVDSLQMPDFSSHNGKSAKTRAEDSKRKRESRKCPGNVQDKEDKNQKKTRPEKRREDISIPNGIDNTAWADYETYRAGLPKKNRLTDKARKIAWGLLAKYSMPEQKQIIETSIMNGWTGLFPPKGAANAKDRRNGEHLTPVQRVEKAFAEHGGNPLEIGGADFR